jgi:hypothetical protein
VFGDDIGWRGWLAGDTDRHPDRCDSVAEEPEMLVATIIGQQNALGSESTARDIAIVEGPSAGGRDDGVR